MNIVLLLVFLGLKSSIETFSPPMSTARLSIFNAQGQMVKQVLVEDQVARVSLDKLASGVYYFVARGDDRPPAMQKVVVAR